MVLNHGVVRIEAMEAPEEARTFYYDYNNSIQMEMMNNYCHHGIAITVTSSGNFSIPMLAFAVVVFVQMVFSVDESNGTREKLSID